MDEIKRLIQDKVNQVVTHQDRENAKEIDLNPDECTDSHLPGDCPLCGAN